MGGRRAEEEGQCRRCLSPRAVHSVPLADHPHAAKGGDLRGALWRYKRLTWSRQLLKFMCILMKAPTLGVGVVQLFPPASSPKATHSCCLCFVFLTSRISYLFHIYNSLLLVFCISAISRALPGLENVNENLGGLCREQGRKGGERSRVCGGARELSMMPAKANWQLEIAENRLRANLNLLLVMQETKKEEKEQKENTKKKR